MATLFQRFLAPIVESSFGTQVLVNKTAISKRTIEKLRTGTYVRGPQLLTLTSALLACGKRLKIEDVEWAVANAELGPLVELRKQMSKEQGDKIRATLAAKAYAKPALTPAAAPQPQRQAHIAPAPKATAKPSTKARPPKNPLINPSIVRARGRRAEMH